MMALSSVTPKLLVSCMQEYCTVSVYLIEIRGCEFSMMQISLPMLECSWGFIIPGKEWVSHHKAKYTDKEGDLLPTSLYFLPYIWGILIDQMTSYYNTPL